MPVDNKAKRRGSEGSVVQSREAARSAQQQAALDELAMERAERQQKSSRLRRLRLAKQAGRSEDK